MRLTEIKGVDSKDKVKHNERSDQLFLHCDLPVVMANY